MDKDTFIAQNVFPKNLDAGTTRRSRLNVKSVSVNKSTRNTKLTFCIMGSLGNRAKPVLHRFIIGMLVI